MWVGYNPQWVEHSNISCHGWQAGGYLALLAGGKNWSPVIIIFPLLILIVDPHFIIPYIPLTLSPYYLYLSPYPVTPSLFIAYFLVLSPYLYS